MLGADENGTVVLDKTPFYALSGGQVGDSGVIKSGDNAFIVADTTKNAEGIFLHSGNVARGIISVGDSVNASINAERRKSIMRNHTAAHLLQAALREVLGTHVEQAGQLVNEVEVRFDFTHFNPLSTEEIKKVEFLVNNFILNAVPVTMTEMPIEEAKKLGAMMLFGENTAISFALFAQAISQPSSAAAPMFQTAVKSGFSKLFPNPRLLPA